MINSTGVEKVFDKNLTSFIIKIIEKVEMGEAYLNITESICEKPTVITMINGEKRSKHPHYHQEQNKDAHSLHCMQM